MSVSSFWAVSKMEAVPGSSMVAFNVTVYGNEDGKGAHTLGQAIVCAVAEVEALNAAEQAAWATAHRRAGIHSAVGVSTPVPESVTADTGLGGEHYSRPVEPEGEPVDDVQASAPVRPVADVVTLKKAAPSGAPVSAKLLQLRAQILSRVKMMAAMGKEVPAALATEPATVDEAEDRIEQLMAM